MLSNFVNYKDCRIFFDWLLSQDPLSLREIDNQLYIRGFYYPSNLACCYSFFLSVYQDYKNNSNIERVMISLQRMIIRQYLEFYDFYPRIDSAGVFGYSSSSARDFE